MTEKYIRRPALTFPGLGIVAGCAASLWLVAPASAQLNQFKNVVGSRVEAGTILGGDYGLSGGAFTLRQQH